MGNEKGQGFRALAALLAGALIISVLLVFGQPPEKTEEAVELDPLMQTPYLKCDNQTREIKYHFRAEIPCYVIHDNKTKDGYCSEVTEKRNSTMMMAGCTCKISENESHGTYFWGGPLAYPDDVYFNYTTEDCVSELGEYGNVTGPITPDLLNYLDIDEPIVVPCPWDIEEYCIAYHPGWQT